MVVEEGFAYTFGPVVVFKPAGGVQKNVRESNDEEVVGLADKLVPEPWQKNVLPENVTLGFSKTLTLK